MRPTQTGWASLFFSFALHQNRDFCIRACHSFLSGGVSCVAPATEHVSFPFRGGAGAAERKSSFAVHAHGEVIFARRGEEALALSSLLLAAGTATMGGARLPVRCCVTRTARPLPACRFVTRARAASRPRTGRWSALLLTLASLAVPRLAMPRALSPPSQYHFSTPFFPVLPRRRRGDDDLSDLFQIFPPTSTSMLLRCTSTRPVRPRYAPQPEPRDPTKGPLAQPLT